MKSSLRSNRLTRILAFGAMLLLVGCGGQSKWHSVDISGSLPRLAFTMTRASDGKTVTAADYRGFVTLLYFGYTYCPDVCPTTLSNVAQTLDRLGPDANHVKVLFVTVDPDRDTLDVLRRYAAFFSPRIDALRGTPNQIAALARRYRVVYSVTPPAKGHPYEVTHSEAIYVFDAKGNVRLLVPSFASGKPDIAGNAADLARLARKGAPAGVIARVMNLL
jgi:protein SCO1